MSPGCFRGNGNAEVLPEAETRGQNGAVFDHPRVVGPPVLHRSRIANKAWKTDEQEAHLATKRALQRAKPVANEPTCVRTASTNKCGFHGAGVCRADAKITDVRHAQFALRNAPPLQAELPARGCAGARFCTKPAAQADAHGWCFPNNGHSRLWIMSFPPPTWHPHRHRWGPGLFRYMVDHPLTNNRS